MEIRAEEISSIIQRQIAGYEAEIEIQEVEYNDPQRFGK